MHEKTKISESRLFNNHFTADFHTNGTFSSIYAMITHNIVRHEVSNFLVTYNVDVKLKIFTKIIQVKVVAECPTYLKQYCPKDRCWHSPEEHRQYRISPLHSYKFSAGS